MQDGALAPGHSAPAPPQRETAFHAIAAEHVLHAVDGRADGLTDAEARERIARFGRNALRAAPPVPAWKILLNQLRSVVVLLLGAAAIISLLVGEAIDAAAIALVLVINTALGFISELRARRAMHALLRLEVPRALVLRDGVLDEIDAQELVPGDVIELDAGRAIPADARVLSAVELNVNEAALTGESVPVVKRPEPVPEAAPLPDRHCMLYKGTVTTTGAARAVVIATGMQTELGRIGTLVGGIGEERTVLERRLDTLGRRLAWVALLVGALVTVLGIVQGVSVARMLATGIALAIAAVPEGLPAVATIALAVGVHRMSRRNALVRRLPSVETLGSVTLVCTDKTGTLTAGEMTLTLLWMDGRDTLVTGAGYDPAGTFERDGATVAVASDVVLHDALRIGALANRADVERDDGAWSVRGDPTEAALLVAARKAGLDRAHLLAETPEVAHVPFSSARMLMATFHDAGERGVVTLVKGAPDRVLALCTMRATATGDVPLDERARSDVVQRNHAMASAGLRVLALARGGVAAPTEAALNDLVFVGLAGISDPPAEGVARTIGVLRDAGIRTVMITGDQQATARAVADSLGLLAEGDEVLDGAALEALSDEALAECMPRTGAFSRVTPGQKLRIVTVCQARGDIVAMLGDGVNDAAALKKADVGVAMGRRGTDVAKEVAAVVLQDDRFATIAAAVEEGRVIYDNIRKFVFYLFSCNLAEVMLLVGAGLAGLPLPLTALQILWLNMVTDTFPALALAMEPADDDVMQRPARDPARAILSRPFMRAVAFYGVLMAASSLAAFVIGLRTGDGARAVTLGFMTLALAQTFHLGNGRSTEHVVSRRRAFANRYAVGAVVLVVLLQLMAVYLPPLARVLGTVPLDVSDWLIIAPLALLTALVGQAIQLAGSVRRRPLRLWRFYRQRRAIP